jgi:H+/gluconate symporter-like permease
MARFRKALVAAALAAASALAPFIQEGLQFNEILLSVIAALVTGLATYGVKNAGFAELGPVADLAEAAYTEYRRVRVGTRSGCRNEGVIR